MEERARKLHQDAIVVDTHCDTLLRVLGRSPYRRQQPYKLGERMRKGILICHACRKAG